jgi:hypothetical protein
MAQLNNTPEKPTTQELVDKIVKRADEYVTALASEESADRARSKLVEAVVLWRVYGRQA